MANAMTKLMVWLQALLQVLFWLISSCAIFKRNGFLITTLALRFGFDTLTILRFTLYDSKNAAGSVKTQFLHYLNKCHTNIEFTVEFEDNSTIPFLEILIKRHSHTFSTSIYRKETFTGLYTKWNSFTPGKYKVSLIRTLTFRCFRICSTPSLLRSCLNELRKLLQQNGYPTGVINYNINDVLKRQQNKALKPTTTVPKKEIILVLSYLGVQSKIVILWLH